VIQLDGPLTPQRRDALSAAGVTLLQYLPAHAYLVRVPPNWDPPAALERLAFVRWVGRFKRAWKLDPLIGTRPPTTEPRAALARRGRVQVVVALFPGESLDAARERLRAHPGTEILHARAARADDDNALIELTLPATEVERLADLAAAQWIEQAPEPVLRNNNTRWVLQSNVTNSTPVWNRGLTGQNQIGGIIDGPIDPDHCSFRDPEADPPGPLHRKFVSYVVLASPHPHGTFTGATFAGDEFPINGTATYRGLAYGAKLAFYDYFLVNGTNLGTTLQANHDAGARVHSNSFGNDSNNNYTTWSRDVDAFSHANEDDLCLFAVTNINGAVTTPENAKNCIGVAGTSIPPNQESWCVGGMAPTQDGRRKPELLAPACNVTSATFATACGFNSAGGGTSWACPAVAGAALLARQYYMDGFYPSGAAYGPDGFTPSGALIKATLINSGTDMTNVPPGGPPQFPTNREGWGRPLLDNALYFAGDARKLIVLADIRNADGLTTGQSHSYSIEVAAGQPLKVTLVWTEKEAAVNANPAYINDLNLVVTAPGPVSYLGNVFSGTESAPGGTADFRNNVEQVLLSAPTAGTFTLGVNALAVNTPGPQGYALMVTGGVSLPVVCTKADMNADTLINGDDINPFVRVVTTGSGTPWELCAADLNSDASRDASDVSAFVACLLTGVCP